MLKVEGSENHPSSSPDKETGLLDQQLGWAVNPSLPLRARWDELTKKSVDAGVLDGKRVRVQRLDPGTPEYVKFVGAFGIKAELKLPFRQRSMKAFTEIRRMAEQYWNKFQGVEKKNNL
jgi:hypothetical protein